MKRFIAAISLMLACAGIPGGAREPVQGYLAAGERPDLTQVLPAPPAKGSARAEADQRLYRESRALQGTPRWKLASDDVSGSMYDHFACALGVRVGDEEAPALNRLLERSGQDRSVVSDAKRHYQTQRPFIGNDLPICEPRTEHLASNGDYPSGHSAHGQHVALILAAIAPDRATPLLARGREYAESRWICGSHSQSATEAGLLSGSAVFAAELNSAEFRSDLERARIELAALRKKHKGEPAHCTPQS